MQPVRILVSFCCPKIRLIVVGLPNAEKYDYFNSSFIARVLACNDARKRGITRRTNVCLIQSFPAEIGKDATFADDACRVFPKNADGVFSASQGRIADVPINWQVTTCRENDAIVPQFSQGDSVIADAR